MPPFFFFLKKRSYSQITYKFDKDYLIPTSCVTQILSISMRMRMHEMTQSNCASSSTNMENKCGPMVVTSLLSLTFMHNLLPTLDLEIAQSVENYAS
jgi:hypothetical protein